MQLPSFNRRQALLFGGTALTGVAGKLLLGQDRRPTSATEDSHGYEKFLSANGQPQILPADKWGPTHEDILGPFFLNGAPFRGKTTPPMTGGDVLVVSGRVWNYATKQPIRHAMLDIWHCDSEGNYDMNDPKQPPARSQFRNRIRLMTDEMGAYEVEAIKPPPYSIGQNVYRPAHIHFLIQAPGMQKLITQLYFAGDKHLKSDRWASQSDLVAQCQHQQGPTGAYLTTTFDIVLQPAG